eukprot:768816-Hanusia_phi.AAC.7
MEPSIQVKSHRLRSAFLLVRGQAAKPRASSVQRGLSDGLLDPAYPLPLSEMLVTVAGVREWKDCQHQWREARGSLLLLRRQAHSRVSLRPGFRHPRAGRLLADSQGSEAAGGVCCLLDDVEVKGREGRGADGDRGRQESREDQKLRSRAGSM